MAGRRFGLCGADEADVVYIRRSLGRPEGKPGTGRRDNAPSLLGANSGSRDSRAGDGRIDAAQQT
jgi:hypothetical protein